GTVRDSIAKAFDVEAEDVEYAHNLLTDYGKVAKIGKVEGEKGLKKVDLELGRPFKVILAENAPTLEEALEDAEDPAIEYKYDGMRTQIHKDGKDVTIFTRRLENVTHQFPDLANMVNESIAANKCIIEGEAVGLSPNGKDLVPFQKLSRRVHRKYDIEEMIDKIPVRLELFDVVYAEGENLMDKSQRERRKRLENIVEESDKVRLAKQLETEDIDRAQEFYKEALDAGQEGLMIKNLNAEYKPGKRVGYWYKVKPVLETLDLVIIGAEWGTGKRGNWLSSYSLGIKDPNTGNFLEVGKLGSGLTEEQLEEMTNRLKPLITESNGREVKIKPEVVIEVKYNEIQKSPNYSSGYALRFPRLESFREDKGPEDSDTTKRLISLYEKQ
ncbi:MAG: ATP-dependent DNA ligase, partial [Candidatus Aenigmatarchaeota archaeon]